MTPAERKALLFLAAVGVLGAGTRAVAGDERAPEALVTAADRAALDAQVSAVDSARAAAGARRVRRPRRAGAGAGGEPLPDHAPARGRAPHAADEAPGAPVDVDVADAAALEALPGIGPALARRIVADRDSAGAFGSLEGLRRVRGVGPRLAERLRPLVTFSGIPRPSSAGAGRRSR